VGKLFLFATIEVRNRESSTGALRSVDALPPGPDLVEIADWCKVVKNAYDQGKLPAFPLGYLQDAQNRRHTFTRQ